MSFNIDQKFEKYKHALKLGYKAPTNTLTSALFMKLRNQLSDPDPEIQNFTIKLNQQRTYATRYKEDEKRTHRTSTTKRRKRIRLV